MAAIAQGRRANARALVSALVAAATAPLLTACSQVLPPNNLKPPALSVSDLSIDGIGRDQLRLRIRLNTRNPNSVDLPLSDLKFDVSLFGQRLAHGEVAEQRFTLPANGEREVPLLLTFAIADVRALLRQAAFGSASEAHWELKGSARWGVSPIPLPFERRGDFSLRALRDLVIR